MNGRWITAILLCANLVIVVHTDCNSYPECHCEHVTGAASDLKKQFCQEPKYAVAPELSRFTAQPQNGLHSSGSSVVLYCNASTNQPKPEIIWSHNGEVLAEGSSYYSISKPTSGSSVLTIPSFSAALQGEYYCRVENGNYSLVSTTASLQLQPEKGTWIDEAYPPQPTSSEINLQVQQGNSAILECHLSTNDFSNSVHWVGDKKYLDFSKNVKDHYQLPNGSLLVRNLFRTSGENDFVEYMCIISLVDIETRRNFNISLDREPAGEQLVFSVIPKSKAVVQGSCVSLYCVVQASTPPTIEWLKDGTAISANSSASAVDFTIVGGGEVLLLNNVTVETGGNYTCVASSGQQQVPATAHVTVYESTPLTSATILVTEGNYYASHSDVFIPMNGKDVHLALSCSQYPASASADFDEFSWAFRGKLIEDSVAFHLDRNTLLINATDPWSIVGALQCFVSNPTGRTQTSIRILPGIPNRPSIGVRRNTEFLFQYILTIHPASQIGNTRVNGYSTEIFIDRSEDDIQKCVCNSSLEDGNTVNFFASKYIRSHLYFRTAAIDKTGSSSAFALYGCPNGIPVDPVAPPPPKLLAPVFQPALSGNVTLEWQLQRECVYPTDLYSTCIQVDCGKAYDQSSQLQEAIGSQYKLSLPCCTSCNWTVTVAYNGCDYAESLSNHSSTMFTTPSLAPTEPPDLLSLDRTLSDGKSVKATIRLPPNNISCDPSKAIIRYSNTTYSNTETAQLEGDGTTRTITTHLSEAECWREYNISVAYSNSAGNSTYSHPMALRGPTQGDVRHYTISILSVSSTTITVGWQLEEGMACLISTGFISGKICCSKMEATCGSTEKEECYPAVNSSGAHIFDKLKPYQNYCLTAVIENGSFFKVSSKNVSTSQSVPGCPPASLSVTYNESVTIEWDPPPRECLNGDLKNYTITIKVTGDGGTSTKTLVTNENEYAIPEYNSTLDYEVSVSACTSVGCGPPNTTKISPKTSPTTATERSTSSTSSNPSTVIIVAIIVPSLVVALALVIVVLVVAKKCSYGPCRKNRDEDMEPFPNAIRDEPLRPDDLPVSVTEHPIPSVSGTHCYALDRYLKDEYDLPDGSVDNGIYEEEDPLQSDLQKNLLDSSSVRDKIGELNYPRRHDRQVEGLELESLPPSAEVDEASERDTHPLISSHVGEQPPTAKPKAKKGAEKQKHRDRKATKQLVSVSLAQPSVTDAQVIQSATYAPLIPSPPKQVQSERCTILNSGYVTEGGASATHIVPPVLTRKEPLCLQALEHCDSAVSSLRSRPVNSSSQQNPTRSVPPTAYLKSPPPIIPSESPHKNAFPCNPNQTSFSLLGSPVGQNVQDSGYVQESTNTSGTRNFAANQKYCLPPPPQTRLEYQCPPSTFPPISTYHSSSHSHGSARTVDRTPVRQKQAATKKLSRQDSGYVQENTASQGDSSQQLHSEDGMLVFSEEFNNFLLDDHENFNTAVNLEDPPVATQQQTALNSQATSRQQYLSSPFELPFDGQSSSGSSAKHPPASASLSHQDSGYVRGSMTSQGDSSHQLQSEGAFNFIEEEFDDSASDNSSHSSVFKEPQAGDGAEGQTTVYQPATSLPSNQKRRRLLTSGIYSQSSESPEPIPLLSDTQGASRTTDTAICTPLNSDIDVALVSERRNSEGYFSEPPTPSSKRQMDFMLTPTSQTYMQGSQIKDSNTTPNTTHTLQVNTFDYVPTTSIASSRPNVKCGSGYYRQPSEKASSIGINSRHSTPTFLAPKTTDNFPVLSRQHSVPQTSTQKSPGQNTSHQQPLDQTPLPSMVTYLYNRSTSMPRNEGKSKCAKLPAVSNYSTTVRNLPSPSTRARRDTPSALTSLSGYMEAPQPFTDGPSTGPGGTQLFKCDSHHSFTSSKTEMPHTLINPPLPPALYLRNTTSAPEESASNSNIRPKMLNPTSAFVLPMQAAGRTGYYTAPTSVALPTRTQSSHSSSSSTSRPMLATGSTGYYTAPTSVALPTQTQSSHSSSSSTSRPVLATGSTGYYTAPTSVALPTRTQSSHSSSSSSTSRPMLATGSTDYYTAPTSAALPTRTQSSHSSSSSSTSRPVLATGSTGYYTVPTLSPLPTQHNNNASLPPVVDTGVSTPNSEPKLTGYVLPSLLTSSTGSAIATSSAPDAKSPENKRSNAPVDVSKSAAAENGTILQKCYISPNSGSQESLVSSDDCPLLAMSEERQEFIEREATSGYV